MRTVLGLTIALGLCACAAGVARADTAQDLAQYVSTYHSVQVVRVIERFDTGGVATVDVMPSGQYRIASNTGQDPAFIIKLATNPIPNPTTAGTSYTVKPLGTKTIDGVRATGYNIATTDKSYVATVWYNPQKLPITADVQTQGHKVNLTFGDYNDQMLIGVAKP